jgi:hypothetical protein
MTAAPPARQTELAAVGELRPHARNYRSHPRAQIAQLEASIREFGILPTTVIARDGTILGGHGVWETARRIGLAEIPVTRLDLDPDSPGALKLLAALNFLGRLALDDEAGLASILAEVAESDAAALLGSGWDEASLTRLLLTSGDAGSDEADEHWRGMPGFESGDTPLHITLNFAGPEDHARLCEILGLPYPPPRKVWWPPKPRDDARAVEYRDG